MCKLPPTLKSKPQMAENWSFKAYMLIILVVIFLWIMGTLFLSFATLPSHDPHQADSSTTMTTENSNEPFNGTLQIFYEFLCPASRHLIVNDFVSVFMKLKDGGFPRQLRFQLIPFGLANYTTDIELNGTTTFNCHHGPEECDGNMIHACALSKYGESESSEQFENLIGFLQCTMLKAAMVSDLDLNNPEEDSAINILSDIDLMKIGHNCSVKFGLNWQDIHNCWKGQEGQDLLRSAGETSARLEPPLKFLPTVVLVNSRNSKQTRSSLTLGSFLCERDHSSSPLGSNICE